MRQLFIVSFLVVAFISLPLFAQEGTEHHPQQKQKMMKDSTAHHGMKYSGKMMHGKMMGKEGKCCQMKGKMGGKCMMGGKGKMLMHSYWHTIKHLNAKQEELELSTAQVEVLKNTAAEFMKKNADWEAGLKKKQIDLKLLFDKNAPAEDVRNILKGIMDVKLELQTAVYETAQKMVTSLTDKQREKWLGMGKKHMSCKGMKCCGMMN